MNLENMLSKARHKKLILVLYHLNKIQKQEMPTCGDRNRKKFTLGKSID